MLSAICFFHFLCVPEVLAHRSVCPKGLVRATQRCVAQMCRRSSLHSAAGGHSGHSRNLTLQGVLLWALSACPGESVCLSHVGPEAGLLSLSTRTFSPVRDAKLYSTLSVSTGPGVTLTPDMLTGEKLTDFCLCTGPTLGPIGG